MTRIVFNWNELKVKTKIFLPMIVISLAPLILLGIFINNGGKHLEILILTAGLPIVTMSILLSNNKANDLNYKSKDAINLINQELGSSDKDKIIRQIAEISPKVNEIDEQGNSYIWFMDTFQIAVAKTQRSVGVITTSCKNILSPVDAINASLEKDVATFHLINYTIGQISIPVQDVIDRSENSQNDYSEFKI